MSQPDLIKLWEEYTSHEFVTLDTEPTLDTMHTQEIRWMLPGIQPTNRRVEVPLVAIVRFRDGKLALRTYLLGSGFRPETDRSPHG